MGQKSYDDIIENNSKSEEYLRNSYPKIMDHLDGRNKFWDPDFRIDRKITGKPEIEALINSKVLRWKRISDIINIKNDKSNEFFLKQGLLGDCYLIAFLRSLQKFQPERYYYLFGICFPEIGYYEIYFFNKKGKHIKVFVDDYILVDENDNPPFSALKDEEEKIYTVGRNLLIEKAYAKMKGSYSAIEGGLNASFPVVGINSISEKDFLSEDDEYIFNKMSDPISKRNIVLCGTINELKNPNPIPGIEGRHMYSLFSTEEDSDLKILQLNNPWGYNRPKKMENFKLGLDKKYEEIEKEIINYNKENTKNGNLKIDIGNFKKQFIHVEICNFKDKKEEQKKPGGEDPIPSLPLEIIEEDYLNRINTFDALGIGKKDQRLLLDKCKGDYGKALYLSFKQFMQHGTSKDTFYKMILEKPSSVLSTLNPLNFFYEK